MLNHFHLNDVRLETKVAINKDSGYVDKIYLEMLRKGPRRGSPF